MKTIFTLLFIYLSVNVHSQTALTRANECYGKKDYQCAVDNYLVSLNTNLYKESDRHLVEYRLGNSYFIMKNYDQAKVFLQAAVKTKPDFTLGWWRLGDIHFNAAKFDSAVLRYRTAQNVAATPADKENLWWWIGNAYVNAKQYSNGIEELKKVISREGDKYKTEGIIGDAFLAMKKYDSAVIYYKRSEQFIPVTDPLHKSVKYGLGKAYRQSGQYDLAVEALNAALKNDPGFALAMWELGIVYVNQNEYPKAIEWYKKAFPLVLTDSSNAYVLSGNIAAVYEKLNNYAEAANWYKKRTLYSKEKYKDYVHLAKLHYGKLKQPKEAEKIALEAVRNYSLEPQSLKDRIKTDYSRLEAILGQIALERKDTAKAIEYFNEAITNFRSSYEANLGLADIAWARKKLDDINKYYLAFYKSDYDTLLSNKEDIARAYARRAYVDIVLNKKNAGSYIADIKTALSFDSLQKEAILLWPVALAAGYSWELTANRQPALSLIDKAIKKYENDKEYVSDLYNAKAVLTPATDTSTIRKALEQAIKIYPENMRPWDNLIKYYTSYDNAAGAVAVDKLIAVLKKKKDNASLAIAYVYKGDFFWRLGKKDDAKKAYQEALVWDANNTTAKERARLQ